MIPVVMSASVYAQKKNLCLQYVMELSHFISTSKSAILIDVDSQLSDHPTVEIAAHHINLSQWIDKASNALRHSKVKAEVHAMDTDKIIVLDARYQDPSLLSTLLDEISCIWFHLETWQPAFVLIVDDFFCARFAVKLYSAFYMQPLDINKQQIQTDLSAMRRRAFGLRWLGFGRTVKILKFVNSYVYKW